MKCNRMDVIGRADREERDCVMEVKDKKKKKSMVQSKTGEVGLPLVKDGNSKP